MYRRNNDRRRNDRHHADEHDSDDELRAWLVFHLSDKIAEFLTALRTSGRIRLAMATRGFTQHHQRRAWRALQDLWAAPPEERVAELEEMFAWYRRWAATARAVVTHRDDLERLGLAAGSRIPSLPQAARSARIARSAA